MRSIHVANKWIASRYLLELSFIVAVIATQFTCVTSQITIGSFPGTFSIVKAGAIVPNGEAAFNSIILGNYSNGDTVNILPFNNQDLSLVVDYKCCFTSVVLTYTGSTPADNYIQTEINPVYALKGNMQNNLFAVEDLKKSGTKKIVVDGYNGSTKTTLTLTLTIVQSPATPTNPSPAAPVTITAPVPMIPTPVTFPNTTVRINVGSTIDWIDSYGNVWIPDNQFVSGGVTINDCWKQIQIGNTELDTLFCTDRFFPGPAGPITGTYTIPVYPGVYNVTIMFAEVWFNSINQRKFSILIQGTPVIESLDLFQVSGKNNAYTVTFPAIVTPSLSGPMGNIVITFKNTVNYAKLNAIEMKYVGTSQPVIPVPVMVLAPVPVPVTVAAPAPTVPSLASFPNATVRINAGSAIDFIDSSGNIWIADKFVVGGFTNNDCPKQLQIGNTELDTLFCTDRYFQGPANSITGEYTIPVYPGMYNVTIMFAEVWFDFINQRKFNILIQGTQVIKDLDLFQVSGKFNAYSVSFPAIVTPSSSGPMGNIVITFINTYLNDAKLNAIDIKYLGIASPAVPTPVTIPTPVAVSVPVPVTVAAPALTVPSLAPFPNATVRINAGSAIDFIDSSGNVWIADKFVVDGFTNNDCPKQLQIGNTELDTLFCTDRYFQGPADSKTGEYTIPVYPGMYNVTIMFAEVWFDFINQRKFNILIQGTQVIKDLDLFQVSGKFNAYSVTFPAIVTPSSSGPMGNIVITFINTNLNDAKLNAIDIKYLGIAPPTVPTPATVPTPVAVPTPIYVAPTKPPLMLDNTKILIVAGDSGINPWWQDSYSVGGNCFCSTDFDHAIGEKIVMTPLGNRTVKQICDAVQRFAPSTGKTGRPIYNTINCGNEPYNDDAKLDEQNCPGRADYGVPGCGYVGPSWNFTMLLL